MAEYYTGIKNTDVYLYILTWEDVQEILISEKCMFKNLIVVKKKKQKNKKLIVVNICIKVIHIILIYMYKRTSGRTNNKMKQWLLVGNSERIVSDAFPFCLSIFSIVKN